MHNSPEIKVKVPVNDSVEKLTDSFAQLQNQMVDYKPKREGRLRVSEVCCKQTVVFPTISNTVRCHTT